MNRSRKIKQTWRAAMETHLAVKGTPLKVWTGDPFGGAGEIVDLILAWRKAKRS